MEVSLAPSTISCGCFCSTHRLYVYMYSTSCTHKTVCVSQTIPLSSYVNPFCTSLDIYCEILSLESHSRSTPKICQTTCLDSSQFSEVFPRWGPHRNWRLYDIPSSCSYQCHWNYFIAVFNNSFSICWSWMRRRYIFAAPLPHKISRITIP